LGDLQTFGGEARKRELDVTRRVRFLAGMGALIRWPRSATENELPCHQGTTARLPRDQEQKLRIYFQPKRFNLSDARAEDEVYDESLRPVPVRPMAAGGEARMNHHPALQGALASACAELR